MYKIIWKFTAKPGMEESFERAYGPDGTWVELFRKAQGYLGSELLRDLSENGSYLTIDTWRSQAAFVAFKNDWEAEYQRLDKRLEALTESEQPIGTFAAVVQASAA